MRNERMSASEDYEEMKEIKNQEIVFMAKYQFLILHS
jgi:hypothetical protein